MRDDFDICIVGGGPSGVITAIGVASAGYSVVILDKKSRDKIGDKNCGDALDGKHMQIIEREMKLQSPRIEVSEAQDLIAKITIAAGDIKNKDGRGRDFVP